MTQEQGDQLGVSIPISVRYDESGGRRAETGVAGIGKAANVVKEEVESLGYTWDNVKKSFVELFALSELIMQVKEAGHQIVEMDAAMQSLGMSAKRHGQDFDHVKKAIEKFSDEMRIAAGVDDDVLIPGIIKAYDALGDLEGALYQGQLAVDLSIKFNRPLAQTLEDVARASQGVTRGTKEYGVTIDESVPASQRGLAALTALEKAAGGASKSARGYKIELARLSESWEDFRNGFVAPMTGGFVKIAKSAMTALYAVRDGLSSIANIGGFVVDVIVNSAKALKNAVTGDVDEAKRNAKAIRDSWVETSTRIVFDHLDTKKKIAEIWDDSVKHIKDRHGDAHKAVIHADKEFVDNTRHVLQERLAAMRAEADAETALVEKYKKQLKSLELAREIDRLADEKGNAKSKEELIAIDRRYNAERVKLLNDFKREALKRVKEEIEEQFKVGQEKLKSLHRVAETEKQIEAERTRRLRTGDAKFRQQREELVAWLRSEEAKITADTEEAEKERDAIRRLYAEKNKTLAQEQEEFKKQVTMQAIGTATAALAGAFQDSKELAVVNAIINTAEGITKAYGQAGIFGYAAAAAIAVAGMAQITTIISAQPGSASASIASPGGDAGAAYRQTQSTSGPDIATRKWAAGVIDKFGGANYSSSYSTTNNVSLHGFGGFIDPNSRRDAQRFMDVMDYVSRTGRESRTTGSAS